MKNERTTDNGKRKGVQRMQKKWRLLKHPSLFSQTCNFMGVIAQMVKRQIANSEVPGSSLADAMCKRVRSYSLSLIWIRSREK